jgi:hypothetical protein
MSVPLLHRRRPRPATGPAAPPTDSARRVIRVHRAGAVVVAAAILAFGVLGFVNGLSFFSTRGGSVAGLSSNGLLSTISVVTAAVLVAAALAGPRIASTVMIVVGALFLISALANLAVLNTGVNLLAFRLPNVFFSIAAGLVLLLLGSYGRVSGNLPADSPYARPEGEELPDTADDFPSTPAEFAAERAMRAAEIAVVQHTATPEQARRVEAMAAVLSRRDRREVWLRSR